MATAPGFIEHVLDIVALGERLTARAMFGEYGFHFEGKFIALACDDSFFIKATPALENHRLELPMRPPYPGARPYPVADELLDDPDRLRALLIDTAAELPAPKSNKGTRKTTRKTTRKKTTKKKAIKKTAKRKGGASEAPAR